jgi:hypothetical protein
VATAFSGNIAIMTLINNKQKNLIAEHVPVNRGQKVS